MLSSLYLFVIGKASIRLISRIADIPQRILFPIVLILCIYGAYAVNNSIFDVTVMFIMGVIGFGMRTLGIPAAPFLIAFILGPLAEDNFRQSLLLSKGDWSIFFSSPICWLFWTLTVVAVVLTVWTNLRSGKTPASEANSA